MMETSTRLKPQSEIDDPIRIRILEIQRSRPGFGKSLFSLSGEGA
jgi:hypothetical protein